MLRKLRIENYEFGLRARNGLCPWFVSPHATTTFRATAFVGVFSNNPISHDALIILHTAIVFTGNQLDTTFARQPRFVSSQTFIAMPFFALLMAGVFTDHKNDNVTKYHGLKSMFTICPVPTELLLCVPVCVSNCA